LTEEPRERKEKRTAMKSARRLLIVLALVNLQVGAAAAAPPAPQVQVGRSLKNDLSRPLRSMRQIPPRRGPKIRVMPEPRPIPIERPEPAGGLSSATAPISVSTLPLSATAGVNFAGIPNVSGVLPPDTNGDVGPNHFVQMVNSAFQIWDKSGSSLLGPSDLSTLWTGFGLPCAGDNDGDPVVLYDSIADRWILSQFVAVAPFYGECIAVSQTGDPTGAYYRYYFPLSTTVFYDYPHLGVWPDGYYMGSNKFNPNYAGSAVIAFERDKMLAGLPAGRQEFATSSTGTPLPADLDGPTLPPAGSPNYIAQIGATLRIYAFHVDWTTPANSTFTGPTALAVSYNVVCNGMGGACVPQPGTTVDLDTLGDRLMHRFAYRNFGAYESMVVNHSVETTSSPPAPKKHASVRWYEVRRTAGVFSIFQQGDVAPDSTTDKLWRWMGSIAMDGSGNMGLGYSVSDGSSVFPGIHYTGRLAGETAGTMQTEATLFAGGGSQLNTQSRWGDYSSMSIDPADDCTFWFTSEYYPASPANDADWKTRIGSFSFAPSNCSPAPKGTVSGTVTDVVDATPIPGVLVAADNGVSTVTNGSGGYSLTLSPGNYSVSASADDRSCNPATPQSVSVSNGGNTIANFQLGGSALLAAISTSINDSGGNNNGKINRDECVAMNVTLRNDGCEAATGISAVLSTLTPGVTVTQANSSYSDLAVAANGANATPFAVSTSPAFVCGTTIAFSLTVTSSNGVEVVNFTVPTCQGSQTLHGAITGGDPAIGDRLGRSQPPSSCGNPKLCPGPLGTAGTYRYDTYSFTNNGDTDCFTVTLNPGSCNVLGSSELHSSAYLGSFNAANVCTNFLADNGFNPTVTTNYSFTVPAGQTAVIVVNEAVSNATCGDYTITIPAIDNTAIGNCGGGSPAMTPAALVVDDAGNGVLEAGETAVVAPSWQHTGSAQATGLTGAAANLTGPVSTAYTLDDSAAAYGNVSVAATASCASGPNCYAATISPPASRAPRHWDATLDETLSTGETKTWSLHVGESFDDVATSHGFYRHIETALHGGVSAGCSATGYCPDLPVTRRELAVFLVRAKDETPLGCVGPDPYGDVPAADPSCPWIQHVAMNGYMGACDAAPNPDLFCPEGPVQRRQIAMLLLRTIEGSSYTPPACAGPDPYGDVPAADAFCPWIQEIKSRGMTLGCGGGDFCPLAPVSRAAMTALVGRGFGLTLYAP
jgi:hypothetical protein